jgi:hypothetical protein
MAQATAPSSKSGSGKTKDANRSLFNVVRRGIYYSSIGVAAIVALWNMQPYLRMVGEQLISFGIQPDTRTLTAMTWVGGVGVWSLLQQLQVYPVILRHNRKVIRELIYGKKRSDSMEPESGDDREVLDLKRWYNSKGSASCIRDARRRQLVGYGIDAAICAWMFPVAPSFGRFLFWLITMQWGRFNWTNAGLIIVMMFVFEAMVRIVLTFNDEAVIFKTSKGK